MTLQIEQALHEIRDYIQNVLRVRVLSFTTHPLGIGIFQFSSTLRRDTILFRQPFQLDDEHTLRFQKHDEAINWRTSTFTRIGWVMLLGFPLDYLHIHQVAHSVSTFGQFIHWHDTDRLKGRVLVKVLIQDIDAVPDGW